MAPGVRGTAATFFAVALDPLEFVQAELVGQMGL